MDIDQIDTQRAALKDMIAKFLLYEKAIEALPVSDPRYERALSLLNWVVKEVEPLIAGLQEALGPIYDAAMDWPTEEELKAHAKR